MLEELETFIAVAEYRNFTKAAQKRNISQPTASVHIKKLEDFFGAFLLERTAKHKNITLTPAGKLLLQSAKAICGELNRAQAAIADLQGKIAGSISIGASQTIGEYFLPEYLGRFTKSYNNLEPEITIANTQKIAALLLAGDIDIGLVEGGVAVPGIAAVPFYEDRLAVITPPGQAVFAGARWIIREEGSASRTQWEEFVKSAGLALNKKPVIFNTNFAVKEAVKNNLGCALISEHIARQAAERGEVELSAAYAVPARSFYYLTAEGRQERRAVQILIEDLLLNFTQNTGKNSKSEI